MKKLLTIFLVMIMSFSLVACGGDSTEETNETTEQNNSNSSKQESVQENTTENKQVVALDMENLTGAWIRHEKDKDLENSWLSFELNADNTGTICLLENEEANSYPIIKWYINETASVVELDIDTDADNIENTIYYLCVCECGGLTDAFLGEPCFIKDVE